MSSRSRVHIFSDGSCRPNPGPGGWGAILRHVDAAQERELSGAEAATTNNRMEMIAVIRALEELEAGCEITITTDSQYLQNGFKQGWLARWKRNGWRTAAGKPVKNDDLWRSLDELTGRHRVRWQWVRGHTGHPENERCDQLANAARERLERGD